jgi:hypothetical protein
MNIARAQRIGKAVLGMAAVVPWLVLCYAAARMFGWTEEEALRQTLALSCMSWNNSMTTR